MKRLSVFCSSLLTLFLLLLTVGCDEGTGSLGNSVTPSTDSLVVRTASYFARTRSMLVDSVLAKSNTVYFGRFTDPETGTMFEADFLTQVNCFEGGTVFPDEDKIVGDSAENVQLRLFFTTSFGDANNAMTLEVYPLDRVITEGDHYYSNADPSQFCDLSAGPLATKAFSAVDYALTDSALTDDDHYANISITLPHTIGTHIIQQFRTNPEYFSGASPFIENVCKGFYVRVAQGDGTIFHLDQVNLDISFRMAENDSLYTSQFVGTQEVLQVNRFRNEGNEVLAADESCTWLKTPSGIFTEVVLPVDDITAENDTINSAKIVFDCYYNPIDGKKYAFASPSTILMLPRERLVSFFENNELTDSETTYYTTLDASYNQYSFGNISRLIAHMAAVRDVWTDEWAAAHPSATLAEARGAYAAEHPNWNVAVLVPVTKLTDSNGTIVGFRHEMGLCSTRLKGGNPTAGGSLIELRIITSAFKSH